MQQAELITPQQFALFFQVVSCLSAGECVAGSLSLRVKQLDVRWGSNAPVVP